VSPGMIREGSGQPVDRQTRHIELGS
jgi:hypothetical protein